MNEKYGKKAVHVVFPSAGQDVAGIRTKAKANGLKLYNPEAYAAEHEVDFGQAKHLLKFFVIKVTILVKVQRLHFILYWK